MNDYKLSQNQLAELEALHRFLRNKREADRVKAVLALARGWSSAQVAEILLFDGVLLEIILSVTSKAARRLYLMMLTRGVRQS